jgi:hypothetical protein
MSDRAAKQLWLAVPAGGLFDPDFVKSIRRCGLFVLAGAIVAALTFYAIAPGLPGNYTSVALLRLDRTMAEALSIQRTNPRLADKFLSGFPEYGATTYARVQHLLTYMRLVAVDPLSDDSGPRLFRLEAIDKDPAVAQSIDRQMIDEWLAITPSLNRSVIIAAPGQATKPSNRIQNAALAGSGAAALLLLLVGCRTLYRRLPGPGR